MDTLLFLKLHFPKSGGHPSRFLALLFLVVLYVIDGLNQTDPTPIAFSNHRFFTYYNETLQFGEIYLLFLNEF